MVEYGIVHGRFQGLHMGHMEYFLEAKKRCRNLIIGITNYEPYLNEDIKGLKDKERTKLSSNPFTYYERYKIIEGSLIEGGVSRDEFDIVPFPIENPEHIRNFVPENAKCFITIYDDWGRQKESRLKEAVFETEVMWERDYNDRFSRGGEVREKIRNGGDWKRLVPDFMYRYVKDNKIDERISKNDPIF